MVLCFDAIFNGLQADTKFIARQCIVTKICDGGNNFMNRTVGVKDMFYEILGGPYPKTPALIYYWHLCWNLRLYP